MKPPRIKIRARAQGYNFEMNFLPEEQLEKKIKIVGFLGRDLFNLKFSLNLICKEY